MLSHGSPKSKGVWHLALVKLIMFRWLGCTGSSLFARLAHILVLNECLFCCVVAPSKGALALACNLVTHKRAKPDTTSSVNWLRTNAFICIMSPQRTTSLISSRRPYPSLPPMGCHRNSLSFNHLNHQHNPCLPHYSIILLDPFQCLCYN